jgi:hypothetical protein
MAYSVLDVQVSLDQKTATVSLRSDGAGMIMIHSFPFDPPGEQSETELRTLALKDAKLILQAAADSL